MTRFLYYFFVLSAALIVEVLLRTIGFWLPLTAFGLFYLTSIRGIVSGVVCAFLTGFLLDALFFHTIPVAALTLQSAVLAAWLLRDGLKMMPPSPWLLMACGALLPLTVLLPPIPFRGGWSLTLESLPILFLSALILAVLLPLTAAILDHFSGRLGLEQFEDIAARRSART